MVGRCRNPVPLRIAIEPAGADAGSNVTAGSAPAAGANTVNAATAALTAIAERSAAVRL